MHIHLREGNDDPPGPKGRQGIVPEGGGRLGAVRYLDPEPGLEQDGAVGKINHQHIGRVDLEHVVRGAHDLQQGLNRHLNIRVVSDPDLKLVTPDVAIQSPVTEFLGDDLTVGQGDKGIVLGLDEGRADVDLMHLAIDGTKFDGVPWSHLFAQQDDDPGEEILENILQGKAKTHAETAHDPFEIVPVDMQRGEGNQDEENPDDVAHDQIGGIEGHQVELARIADHRQHLMDPVENKTQENTHQQDTHQGTQADLNGG